jgi:hypothetical protein
MARYLEGRGLGLRLIPANQWGRLDHNAFLVRGNYSLVELEGLPKNPASVHLWQGRVFCERWDSRWEAEQRAESWEDACLLACPFVFFGDPELLARFRDVLTDPGG